jgi:tetratricopeptide (TPR) repeat protein
MKTSIWLGLILLHSAFCILPLAAPAATNDLTSLLQQGLFEEQANRNLDAAISDYQSLAAQFDKDRQIAATAIFRLGECYRKLGNTNEAIAQYERIVREFPDQQTLATLSRQNLAGLGSSGGSLAAPADADTQLLERLHNLPREQLEQVLPTLVPDALLTTLLQQRLEAEKRLEELKRDYSPLHPIRINQQAVVNLLNKRISEKIDGMLTALQIRAASAPTPANPKAAHEEQKRLLEQEIKLAEQQLASQQKLVEVGKLAPDEVLPVQRDLLHLRQQMATLDAGQPLPNASAEAAEVSDNEDQEIHRIQQLIQNSPDLINAPPAGGVTPLRNAAGNGQVKVATFLLDHGAGVNVDQGDGWAALHDAARVGNRAMVELLLSRGADVNARANKGQTPLWVAVDKGYQAITEALLAKRADVNVPDKQAGKTPLHLAAKNGGVKILQMLLAAGANPNPRDLYGNTPLHFATSGLAHHDAVELLLDHGADPNVRNNDGQTPLDYIKGSLMQYNMTPGVKASLSEIAALLRSHGALDNLPHWDRISVSRPSANYSDTVFRKGTNDWNRFTLLETILNYYESERMHPVPVGYTIGAGYSASVTSATISFPDLTRLVIVRPAQGTTNETRININLLNSTNGIDGFRDVPLEFGDVVEIPECEHTLAESDKNTPVLLTAILNFLRSKPGSVRLIIAGGQTIQVPLEQFEPYHCYLRDVLQSSQAQNVLTTDSDLYRVKVTHRDPTTGKRCEWVLNLSDLSTVPNEISVIPNGPRFGRYDPQPTPEPNLWLRDGDVIEVPEK